MEKRAHYKCENCQEIFFQKEDACPKCGSEDIFLHRFFQCAYCGIVGEQTDFWDELESDILPPRIFQDNKGQLYLPLYDYYAEGECTNTLVYDDDEWDCSFLSKEEEEPSLFILLSDIP